mmetsp:Transcript_1189/g.1669  ORF Transcript_1189/g.1669 Transcript_1189/m.1669 type:complete len:250 (+) Transcript_1189:233-982(+)
MGQCCTNRNGSVQAGPGFPEKWAFTHNGAYSSNGDIPTVRRLTECVLDRPCSSALFLGNSISGTDEKMIRFHRIRRRIEVCTKKDLMSSKGGVVTTPVSAIHSDVLIITICPIKKTTLTSTIEKCVRFIWHASGKGHNILIHSKNRKHQTESWSIAIACGCLMKMHSWSLKKALHAIKTQSPEVELSFELGSHLQEYEKTLFRRKVNDVSKLSSSPKSPSISSTIAETPQSSDPVVHLNFQNDTPKDSN